MRLFVAAAALLLPSLCAQQAAAQAVYSHPVHVGDTYASIAQQYYGDPSKEAVLREANFKQRDEDGALTPGSWVFIPTVSYYTVKPGDTWASIANALYGAENRASVLIAANRGSRRTPPIVGEEILVSYPLRYVVEPNETYAKIASRFIGDDSKGPRRVRRFNPGIPLQKGQVLLVPIQDLVLSAEVRERTSEAFSRAAGGGGARDRQQEVDEQLPQLIGLVKNGAYAEAVALGNRFLAGGGLLSTQVVTIQKALAVAYVALGRDDLAVAAFRAALTLQPNLELDTVRTSPRVLAVFESAKEPLED